MTPVRIAALLFIATLQFACSRPSDSPAGSAKQHAFAGEKISEDQALAVLMSELKKHNVDGLGCLGFMSENETPANEKAELWEFAAHEIHNERCGGDPGVSPVRDRYKVNSANKVWVYDAPNGEYKEF